MSTYAEDIRNDFLRGRWMDSILEECRRIAVAVKSDCDGTGYLYEVVFSFEDGSRVRLVNPYGYDWPGCKPDVKIV